MIRIWLGAQPTIAHAIGARLIRAALKAQSRWNAVRHRAVHVGSEFSAERKSFRMWRGARGNKLKRLATSIPRNPSPLSDWLARLKEWALFSSSSRHGMVGFGSTFVRLSKKIKKAL